MNNPLPPEALDNWAAAVAAELGIPTEAIPVPTILDLARDVAHGVARPAAPLTAFIVGLAVGTGHGTPKELTERVTKLAEQWNPET